jgi:hypothetical protein
VELAWVGDFNKKMLALHEATGAKKEKVHRTYRYVFNLLPAGTGDVKNIKTSIPSLSPYLPSPFSDRT